MAIHPGKTVTREHLLHASLCSAPACLILFSLTPKEKELSFLFSEVERKASRNINNFTESVQLHVNSGLSSFVIRVVPCTWSNWNCHTHGDLKASWISPSARLKHSARAPQKPQLRDMLLNSPQAIKMTFPNVIQSGLQVWTI